MSFWVIFWGKTKTVSRKTPIYFIILLLKLQILSFQCLQHLKILQRICNRSTEHFKIELTLTFTNVAQKHSVSILWSFKRARSRFGDG